MRCLAFASALASALAATSRAGGLEGRVEGDQTHCLGRFLAMTSTPRPDDLFQRRRPPRQRQGVEPGLPDPPEPQPPEVPPQLPPGLLLLVLAGVPRDPARRHLG